MKTPGQLSVAINRQARGADNWISGDLGGAMMPCAEGQLGGCRFFQIGYVVGDIDHAVTQFVGMFGATLKDLMGALEFERQPMKYDLLAATPITREGTMVEIADGVEFLTSSRASFITGIDLLIDGGVTAALRHRP